MAHNWVSVRTCARVQVTQSAHVHHHRGRVPLTRSSTVIHPLLNEQLTVSLSLNC